jgi:hypothetical protein
MTASEGSRARRVGSTERLLVAVVEGNPLSDAARAAGMSEETARRRLREPEAKARLDELRASVLSAASDRLADLSVAAAAVLGRLMHDETLSASVRIRAASEILGRVLPLREAARLDERLAQIEAALQRRDERRSLR